MKHKKFFIAFLAEILLFIPLAVQGQTKTNLSCIALSQNLKLGPLDSDTVNEVNNLQEFLFALGYYPHGGVGEFGARTFLAVKSFQSDYGLPSTGFVGPMTRNLIKYITCKTSTPSLNDPNINIGASQSNQVPSNNSSSTPIIATSTQNQTTSASSTDLTNKKILPFTSIMDSGWKGVWGSVSKTEDKTLLLKATASTTGAEALLSDSSAWTNYKYTVNANTWNGSASLIARYFDDNNFLTCSFDSSSRYLALSQTVEGIRTTLSSMIVEDYPRPISLVRNVNISMSVLGNDVSCTVLGNTPNVSGTILDDKLSHGGIGISTWYENPNIAKLELRDVMVTQLP
jgi:peptidoglycan hydrolase-like protein with peptidoglycan-binding domain